jgi:hypothetical protein
MGGGGVVGKERWVLDVTVVVTLSVVGGALGAGSRQFVGAAAMAPLGLILGDL